MRLTFATIAAAIGLDAPPVTAQVPRTLMPIDFVNSAEFGWLEKPVHASRVLDDMTQPATWTLTGTGRLAFPAEPGLGDMRVLRVEMQLFRGTPAPTRSRLSSVNLERAFANEDWRGYNRLSLWVRPEFTGIPVLPLQIVLHNDGAEKVPDRYNREGTHYVTLARNRWQQVVWEIEPLARDRITRIEIGYFVNKMLADPGDRVAFEIARLELQRVDPDHHTGWSVAPGKIAFSHTGYQAGTSKTAIASGLGADDFQLIRVSDNALGETVLRKQIRTVRAARGEFQLLDFSEIEAPGSYVLRAGDVVTRPFRVGDDVWKRSIWKTLNFFYGNRCGYDVCRYQLLHRPAAAVLEARRFRLRTALFLVHAFGDNRSSFADYRHWAALLGVDAVANSVQHATVRGGISLWIGWLGVPAVRDATVRAAV